MKKTSARKPRTRSRKVLLPIGDATEVMDTMYPMFRLPEDGFEVVVCGPEARLYHGVLHEIPPTAHGEPKWDITRESAAYHIRATVAFKDVDPREYCGLFVSGGRAPEYLRYDKDLLRITRHFFEANKPVASLCHGVEILTAADCIRGRTLTTVAKCAMDVEQGGAKYVNERVVVDGNLVTSRVWMDNTWLLKEFVAMLKRYTANA
ncbi:MAG: DJ-1/PfpI family protein [Verrucomicrobia bacterium]|nr:DJ-1/PfpI family protein [Verrucomicrobiota bacterium]